MRICGIRVRVLLAVYTSVFLATVMLVAGCNGMLGPNATGNGGGSADGPGGSNGTVEGGSGNGNGTGTGSGTGSGSGSGTGTGTGNGSGTGTGTGTGTGPIQGGAGGPGALKMPGLVVYWGQNGYGGAHPTDKANFEKDLASTCTANPGYGAVILSFVTSFVRTRNLDGYPEMNFANHCETGWDDRNPFLLKCPDIATGIQTCQQQGKIVLLSLGGASGGYGFVSDAEAKTFAQTAWDMFLGGSSTVRPFGGATLDGVDLDLEGGSSTGYSAFVTALRGLMTKAPRHYFITAAPQCVFPDAYLGPAPGKALGDVPQMFDWLNVQFYNNYCAGSSGASFTASWNQWAGVAQNGGPKILVGLPATTAAGGGWVAPGSLGGVLAGVKSSPAYGGVMLWDASFDQNSGTTPYSVSIKGLL